MKRRPDFDPGRLTPRARSEVVAALALAPLILCLPSSAPLFLRVPGAPLSNNRCERALKEAILRRKNSLFSCTLNGAQVGDRFMGLIHTSELHQVEPFDYLVAMLRHPGAVALDPAALARLASEASEPAPD